MSTKLKRKTSLLRTRSAVYLAELRKQRFQAAVYRIAEEAHKTGSETYVRELCLEVASEFHLHMPYVYQQAKDVYEREFEQGDE